MRSSRPRLIPDTEYIPLGKPSTSNLPDLLRKQPDPLPNDLIQNIRTVPPLRLKIKSGNSSAVRSTISETSSTSTAGSSSCNQHSSVIPRQTRSLPSSVDPSVLGPAAGPGRMDRNLQSLLEEQRNFSSHIESLIAKSGSSSALQSHTQWNRQRPNFADMLLNSKLSMPPMTSSTPSALGSANASLATLSPIALSVPAPSAHPSPTNDYLANAINSTIGQ